MVPTITSSTASFPAFYNRRHDEYGCDTMENRARFMTEIIQGAKKRCGQDYPIEVLMNGTELGLPNGDYLCREHAVCENDPGGRGRRPAVKEFRIRSL